LRKFKHFLRQVGVFVAPAVPGFQLQRQPGDAIPQLGVLAGKRVGIDFVEQA
jgi:hypothetical protein